MAFWTVFESERVLQDQRVKLSVSAYQNAQAILGKITIMASISRELVSGAEHIGILVVPKATSLSSSVPQAVQPAAEILLRDITEQL